MVVKMTTKEMDKNSQTGEKAPVNRVTEILKTKGLYGEIEKIFREKSGEYINRHFSLDGEKLRISLIDNDFRSYIDGIEVKNFRVIKDRVTLINQVILVRVVNVEKFNENTTGLILRKMSNGSYRFSGHTNNIYTEI
jgi:hypothetical protein